MQHAMRCDAMDGEREGPWSVLQKPAALHQCIPGSFQCLLGTSPISRLFYCNSRGWPKAPGSDSDSRIASMQPTPPSSSNPPNPPWPSDVARRCKALQPDAGNAPCARGPSPRRCGAQCQVMDCRVWTEASAANTHRATAQHAPAAGTVTAVTRPGVLRSGVA